MNKLKDYLRTWGAQFFKGEGVLIQQKVEFIKEGNPQGSHSHISLTRVPSDFFGSEILAKSDFFGSMKDAWIFFWVTKKTEEFLGGCEKRTKGFF